MPGTNEAFSNGELASVDSRARFVEKAADELKGLHDGNIARYRLRLSEFRNPPNLYIRVPKRTKHRVKP